MVIMGKTYTCAFCGKVGSDFVKMAKGKCPLNPGGGHQIPVLGDMKIKPGGLKADGSFSEFGEY